MFGIESLQSKMTNICREGIVDMVYPSRHSCRVVFPDRGNMKSAELPVLTVMAGLNQLYCLPNIGDRVAVIGASNDVQGGGGYVLGAIFTPEHAPVKRNEKITRLDFDDSAFIEYDRTGHAFTLQFADGSQIKFTPQTGLDIKVKGNIQISGDKNLEAKIKAQIDVKGEREVKLNAKEVKVTASGDITMRGDNIRLN